ncbi:MAG: MFS transporter [Hyphomicrobiaceae bacterium]|nr:MFS transporter [Hyphomicrobiaceae bacterium]
MSALSYSSLRRSPLVFLMVLAAVNVFGFAAWNALLNNFAKESVSFTGADMGLLQSIREIPGLLAVTALIWLYLMREQTLAYVSLILLATGIAMTGLFPTHAGLWMTTFIMSVGFHYFETMNQSLALQLIPKAEAPKALGKITAAASLAQLVAFGLIALVWSTLQPGYTTLFLIVGGFAIAVTVAAIVVFPRFEGAVAQRKGLVLRKRYWLYYALTLMSGARRQIFTAFGAFLLVETFKFDVSAIATLFLATYGLNMVFAPRLGELIGLIGERRTIMFENISLIAVFIGYALAAKGLIPYASGFAAAFFVLDGVFFTFTIAQRTYFQKVADPADIAPTAGVAFTINHIAAVFIPVLFGLIWLKDASLVFVIGAGIATISLSLAFLVPRHPTAGAETVLTGRGVARPAE